MIRSYFHNISKSSIWLTVGLLALALQTGFTQDGQIGMKAPEIQVSHWIHGEKVNFSEDNIIVLEFWATWCNPCREAIPEISRIQKLFKDKNVTIIGVSDEPKETVERFVKKHKSKFAYHVAVSNDGYLHKNYLKTFGVSGIPHAFVINKERKIIWDGHPQDGLEEVLHKVVGGKFTVKDAIAHKESKKKAIEHLEAMQDYLISVSTKGENKENLEAVEKVIIKAKDNPHILNHFAWLILTHPQLEKKRNVKLALKAAEAAHVAERNNPNISDTLARALFMNGKINRAIKMQEAAIKQLEASKDKSEKFATFQKTLEEYKKKSKSSK